MNENEKLGLEFGKIVNKKYGVITYSGTLAIELALKCLNLTKGDKVLVSSEVCSSIVNSIKKLGLTPVLVVPKNKIILTDEDIKKVLIKQKISCIILVHQYGIINEISKKIYKTLKIKIIEDIAQSWIDKNTITYIGKNSDIVVTSFGKTKPLSYGVGGGMFFNDKTYIKYFDFCDNKSREKKEILCSYLYPLCHKINFKKLCKKGDAIVNIQRRNSILYYKLLKKYCFVNFLDIKKLNKNTWHRLPIYFENQKFFLDFIFFADKYKLNYQIQHKKCLTELPVSNNAVKLNYNKKQKYYILLKTRNINIIKQLITLNKIMKRIEKRNRICYNNSV